MLLPALIAALVDARTRGPTVELAQRLGTPLSRTVRGGTAGRLDWLRRSRRLGEAVAWTEANLRTWGVDPESEAPSPLDSALPWYVTSLGSIDPGLWPTLAPLPDMLDWSLALQVPLAAPLTVLEASQRTHTWHDEAGAGEGWDHWAYEVRTWLGRHPALPGSGEVVVRLPDGVSVVALRPKDLRDEGEFMGHCVGNANYRQGVEQGTGPIWSVRTPEGYPVVTIEGKPLPLGGVEFKQVRGPKNTGALARYSPAIRAAWTTLNAERLARMAARKEQLRLTQVGVYGETLWAEGGWSLQQIEDPDTARMVRTWLGIPSSQYSATAWTDAMLTRFSDYPSFVLVDPDGDVRLVWIGLGRSGQDAPMFWRMYGPDGADPDLDARWMFLLWYLPRFRQGELEVFFRSGVDRGHPKTTRRDGLQVPDAPLPAGTVFEWISRDHPEFSATVLTDPYMALLYAQQVDRASAPDTYAVVDAMEPPGFPQYPEGGKNAAGQVLGDYDPYRFAAERKSTVAYLWLSNVDRSLSTATSLWAWATWTSSRLYSLLCGDPKLIESPGVLVRVLDDPRVFLAVFQLPLLLPDAAKSVMATSWGEKAFTFRMSPAFWTRPEVRGAALARPWGALGYAIQIDRGVRPETLEGVLGSPDCALAYLREVCHRTLEDGDPRLREAVAKGDIWRRLSPDQDGVVLEVCPDPTRTTPLSPLVLRAADLDMEGLYRRRVRALLEAQLEDVAGGPVSPALREAVDAASLYLRSHGKAGSVLPLAARVNLRAIRLPPPEPPGWEDGEVAWRWPTNAEQKTKKGEARLRRLQARLAPLPSVLWLPVRGASPKGLPRVHAVSSAAPSLLTGLDPWGPENPVTLVQAWWAARSPEERAGIRADLGPAPEGRFDPVDAAPLGAVGLVWVGMLPRDAFSVGPGTSAVGVKLNETPLLGSFPWRLGSGGIGYFLVYPANSAVLDRRGQAAFATDARFSSKYLQFRPRMEQG